jgi:hypothetical protein
VPYPSPLLCSFVSFSLENNIPTSIQCFSQRGALAFVSLVIYSLVYLSTLIIFCSAAILLIRPLPVLSVYIRGSCLFRSGERHAFRRRQISLATVDACSTECGIFRTTVNADVHAPSQRYRIQSAQIFPDSSQSRATPP